MVMLCILYGLKYATVFREEWVPLVSDIVYKGTIFNWGVILSANLKLALTVTKDEDPNVKANLYMSSYLMDACCAQHHF